MSLGEVVLTAAERDELERRARGRSLAVEVVKRAKVILMLAAGHSYSEISQKLACTARYISGWKLRFKQERLVDFGTDPAWAQGWLDPLEQLSFGQGAWD